MGASYPNRSGYEKTYPVISSARGLSGGGGGVSNWSDRIVIVGVGMNQEKEEEIKEAILNKIEEKLS